MYISKVIDKSRCTHVHVSEHYTTRVEVLMCGAGVDALKYSLQCVRGRSSMCSEYNIKTAGTWTWMIWERLRCILVVKPVCTSFMVWGREGGCLHCIYTIFKLLLHCIYSSLMAWGWEGSVYTVLILYLHQLHRLEEEGAVYTGVGMRKVEQDSLKKTTLLPPTVSCQPSAR